ncbi:TetR family transcriptional regulator [Agromyces sp. NBRC 114283]|uniref:TetR/AcrR family transcriptional regulator n=2 Tax=Agromyces TaxID=33877 RepID=UPI001E59C89D|nr:TetR/AcrR family transcriptional regulator [Agromyces mediolanus]MCD1571453.1 TetR/AcrR family transcriptional regulator [Agromyces mediolanus]GLU87876.1 TetR family transcriptional regulator [Agromyces sp. NBRC 114283]
MSSMVSKTDRIPATERREQILEAATRVFGELGYAGATTDRVAKAAGISQPYVVRMFGTKEQLFIEVLERTCELIVAAFDRAVADEASDTPVGPRIGEAYVHLVETERGVLLALMQGFILGHDPNIGPVARRGFLRIYDRMREVMSPDEAMRFMAQGMLINTLIASNLTVRIDEDERVDELFACTFGDKLGIVLEGLSRSA